MKYRKPQPLVYKQYILRRKLTLRRTCTEYVPTMARGKVRLKQQLKIEQSSVGKGSARNDGA